MQDAAATTSALVRSQAARRARVIEAAMELGDEGGYEAVQMRDVAARAGVAMGTIYRYFSSKDHVLAAALAQWAEDLRDEVTRVPPRGETVADRVVEVLRRALRRLQRQPRLAAALVTSLSSAELSVAQCQRDIAASTNAAILDAIGDASVGDRDDVLHVLNLVWYATLVGWTNGWQTVSQAMDDLETAARLLLKDAAS